MSLPAPTATKHLSWSRLQTYSDCGEKYRLTYVEKVPREPQGYWIGGGAIHDAIQWAESGDLVQEFLEGGALTESKSRQALEEWFLHRFDELLEEAGGRDAVRWAGRKTKEFPDGEDDRWWHKSGPMMLRRFLEVRMADHESGVRLWDRSVERSLVTELPSGTTLSARVDVLLAVDTDGTPFIRDYKAGKPGGADPLQLVNYAWLIGEALGILPRRGEFCYLRAVDVKKRVREFDLGPWLEDVDVPATFAQLEQLVDSGIFLIQPSSYCVSCPVRRYCRYGRHLDGGEDS
jgi:hypothetical protein